MYKLFFKFINFYSVFILVINSINTLLSIFLQKKIYCNIYIISKDV